MKVTPRKWWATEKIVAFPEPERVGFENFNFGDSIAASELLMPGERRIIFPQHCVNAWVDRTWDAHSETCIFARLIQYAIDHPDYGAR